MSTQDCQVNGQRTDSKGGNAAAKEKDSENTNSPAAAEGEAAGNENPSSTSIPGATGAPNVAAAAPVPEDQSDIDFVPYKDEHDMPGIVELIEKDLSEPYSVFTYRYFINNWPDLCFLTRQEGRCVGAIVCKLDLHRSRNTHRGYIAMLAVEKNLRGRRIGSKLVQLCLDRMKELGADECVLEAEVTNKGALALYRSMGFVKEKRLHKYYLNGNDAFRLKFLFKLPEGFDQGMGCLGPPTSGKEDVSGKEEASDKEEAAAAAEEGT